MEWLSNELGLCVKFVVFLSMCSRCAWVADFPHNISAREVAALNGVVGEGEFYAFLHVV